MPITNVCADDLYSYVIGLKFNLGLYLQQYSMFANHICADSSEAVLLIDAISTKFLA